MKNYEISKYAREESNLGKKEKKLSFTTIVELVNRVSTG